MGQGIDVSIDTPSSGGGEGGEGHYNALDNGPLEKFIAKVLYRSVFYTFIAFAHLIHLGWSDSTNCDFRKGHTVADQIDEFRKIAEFGRMHAKKSHRP